MVNNTLYHLLVLTWGLRYFWKSGCIKKGCVEIKDWGTSVYYVLRFRENYMQSLCSYKGILKVLFSFVPWLLNFWFAYGSKSRKDIVKVSRILSKIRLLSKRLGRSTPYLSGVKSLPNPSTRSSIPLDGLLLA